MVQKIIPNLWFDGNAKEAADFYTSIFPNASVLSATHYPKSKEEGLADFQLQLAGEVLTVEFVLDELRFVAINAGPEFVFNQSISFMLNFDPSTDTQAREHFDELWAKLVDAGSVLMPVQEYPFSKRYGWLKDKFGVSWQFILSNPEGEPRPFIVPSFLFGAEVQNQPKEAVEYYTSVFKNAHTGMLAPYPETTGPAAKGALMFADFMLENQWFAAMDSGVEQSSTFNEAISFAINCSSQEEIDYYWEKLSKNPQHEQCGWCKDQYGMSWQIVPENMGELMKKPNAYQTMMGQKKIIIAEY